MEQHLESWSAEQLSQLLLLRPDLSFPSPPCDLAELAFRAQHRSSIGSALEQTTLAENRLVQLLVLGRRNPTDAELEADLPEGLRLDDVLPVLAGLERLALVWRSGARTFFADALVEANPHAGNLGPPLRQCITHERHDYFAKAVQRVRTDAGDAARSVPRAQKRTKQGLIDELTDLLSSPAVVQAALAAAPVAAVEMARKLASGKPVLAGVNPSYLYASSTRQQDHVVWLHDRGLLLSHNYSAVQPREVTIALRGGRPIADLALEPPHLAVQPAPASQVVDADAARQGTAAVDAVAELCTWLAAEPMAGLKDGGLGARALSAVTKRLGRTSEEAACLVECAHAAGLLQWEARERGKGRESKTEYFAVASQQARSWLAMETAERWRHLAGSWLRTALAPGAAGRKLGDDSKALPAMEGPCWPNMADQRRAVLETVLGLGDETGASGASLAPLVHWRRPLLFMREPGVVLATELTLAEASVLGVISHGRLSSFGEALIDGSERLASTLFAAASPPLTTEFTVQADHTVVAIGTLARSLETELALVADIESRGAACTYRITERSLRRALDHGRDVDEVLAFLDRHASRGVPQALRYLVLDVGRRYGNLRVGGAGSFVRCDDAALLADAVSHKRTKKLGLTLVVPTVAVCRLGPDQLLDGLRDAGFLPAAFDARSSSAPAGADVIELRAGHRDPNAGDSSEVGLLEPFAGDLRYNLLDVFPSGEDGAETVASAIGRALKDGSLPPGAVPRGAATGSSAQHTMPDGTSMPFYGFWEGDMSRDELDRMVRNAMANGHVLLVAETWLLEGFGPEDMIPLMPLAIQAGRLHGIDLDNGEPMSVPIPDLGMVFDVGPSSEIEALSEVLDLEGLSSIGPDDALELVSLLLAPRPQRSTR
ncbi:MAG: helicase-associated domain-containing protein [Actinobacteria bacterium]|nr:helicase-associated domain-containing protein [Actinomycetota bacterium]